MPYMKSNSLCSGWYPFTTVLTEKALRRSLHRRWLRMRSASRISGGIRRACFNRLKVSRRERRRHRKEPLMNRRNTPKTYHHKLGWVACLPS